MPTALTEPARPLNRTLATQADVRSEPVDTGSVLTTFGTFRPVGHVMLGLPNQNLANALVLALHAAGWSSEDVLHFSPHDSVAELTAMVEGAGAMAGFGYEITLLRRYLALSQSGCRWLLVKVDDAAHAAKAAALAKQCDAVLAVHYHRFIVEELFG